MSPVAESAMAPIGLPPWRWMGTATVRVAVAPLAKTAGLVATPEARAARIRTVISRGAYCPHEGQ